MLTTFNKLIFFFLNLTRDYFVNLTPFFFVCYSWHMYMYHAKKVILMCFDWKIKGLLKIIVNYTCTKPKYFEKLCIFIVPDFAMARLQYLCEEISVL